MVENLLTARTAKVQDTWRQTGIYKNPGTDHPAG